MERIKAAIKYRRARQLRVQSACKGHGFILTKLRGKAAIRHENGLNDWILYGEKQPHDLSRRPPRNELKDLRSYGKIYSRTNTVKDKVHAW